MAWSASKIFRPFIADAFGNVAALDLDADALKVALFNNSITPDSDVTSANSAFNAGQWANTNEVSNSTHWPAGGIALANKVLNSASAGIVFLDADDTPSADSSATLSGVYGAQLYDSTLSTPVANQGISFHYFGGTQSVTAGLFTVVWSSNGILRVTIS